MKAPVSLVVTFLLLSLLLGTALAGVWASRPAEQQAPGPAPVRPLVVRKAGRGLLPPKTVRPVPAPGAAQRLAWLRNRKTYVPMQRSGFLAPVG